MSAPTIALMLLLPMPLWVRGAIAAACAIAAAVAMVNALNCDRWRITIGVNRRIVVEHGGRERVGVVLDASYVTRDLTCIVWLEQGARLARAIPVPRDALSREDHRRLRLALRYSRPEDDPSGGRESSAAAWVKGDLAI